MLIAIAASCAAIDLAGRVPAASGRARLAWLSGAAGMGIGIWAMHVKGMLAFRLPVIHRVPLAHGFAVAPGPILASAFAL